MGLRDTLFGRTKQVAPNLDNLFGLPTAALTLESELDLVSSGQAGLCFKSGSGESAVFGFVAKTPPGEGSVRMVYLMKQGTFYPFAPTGPSQRDNELELRVKSFLGTDLPIEKDLSRWMALWNLPVS